jgi:hypothetical protein
MTNRTGASSALFGGALPPAGDGLTPAFLFAHPPCEMFARCWADRLNAHGYSVARNPNHRWRRRRALLAYADSWPWYFRADHPPLTI